jgi:hypothetical protein
MKAANESMNEVKSNENTIVEEFEGGYKIGTKLEELIKRL